MALGLSSYSLYLIHQLLLQFLHDRMSFDRLPFGWAVEVAIAFLCIALLAYAMYTYAELPGIRAG